MWIFFFYIINLKMAQSSNTTTSQTQPRGGENQSQTFVNSQTQTFIDSNSYYRLHPSDNPGIVFVICVLSWDNYPTWSRAMENSLMLRIKSHLLMEQYLQRYQIFFFGKSAIQSMVISWLFNSISCDLNDNVTYTDNIRIVARYCGVIFTR